MTAIPTPRTPIRTTQPYTEVNGQSLYAVLTSIEGWPRMFAFRWARPGRPSSDGSPLSASSCPFRLRGHPVSSGYSHLRQSHPSRSPCSIASGHGHAGGWSCMRGESNGCRVSGKRASVRFAESARGDGACEPRATSRHSRRDDTDANAIHRGSARRPSGFGASRRGIGRRRRGCARCPCKRRRLDVGRGRPHAPSLDSRARAASTEASLSVGHTWRAHRARRLRASRRVGRGDAPLRISPRRSSGAGSRSTKRSAPRQAFTRLRGFGRVARSSSSLRRCPRRSSPRDAWRNHRPTSRRAASFARASSASSCSRCARLSRAPHGRCEVSHRSVCRRPTSVPEADSTHIVCLASPGMRVCYKHLTHASAVLRHDAHLLRERRPAPRARVHDDRRRRAPPLPPASAGARRACSRAPTSTA